MEEAPLQRAPYCRLVEQGSSNLRRHARNTQLSVLQFRHAAFRNS